MGKLTNRFQIGESIKRGPFQSCSSVEVKTRGTSSSEDCIEEQDSRCIVYALS